MYARFFAINLAAVFVFILFSLPSPASHHYTDKQLEALAGKVGQTYWVVVEEDRRPSFFNSPSPSAASFPAEPKDSFVISELVGVKAKNPYYKVKFASGKEGYIPVESFLEEFNATLVTKDPDSDQKRKLARDAEQESERVAWIRAQPWPERTKEAALRREVVPGMSAKDVKMVLGKPNRIVKLKNRHQKIGEQWIYANGFTLTFSNGLLTGISKK